MVRCRGTKGNLSFALSLDESEAVTLMQMATGLSSVEALHLRHKQRTLSPATGKRVFYKR